MVKNKIKPVTKIKLDKERSLALDFNALAAMEEVLGESALDGSIFKEEKLRQAKYIRAILYGLLKAEDESITLEQVGGLISMTNIEEIMTAVAEVLTGSMSKGSAGDEGNA